MSDQEIKEIKEKLNQLNRKQSPYNQVMNFLFNAAMPIAIAVIGIYFTNQNNQRQIEFQQIQVANQMVADVQSDPDFTKEKLDLKLFFVENMFENPAFKAKVKNLLSQTYAVSLQSMDLGQLAASGDAEDAKYVQNKIAEAKKFGDTSINKVVNQLEKKEPVRKLTKPDVVKEDGAPTPSQKTDSIIIKRNPKTGKADSVKNNQSKKPGRDKSKQ
ncbi:MAG TPA: hypothetical protein PLD84_02645 [Chitinophagales bacterium]|nr:hypothetical protein [Chitinophagales bacterium]